MYDLRQLRDNLDSIRERLGRRGTDVPWDNMKALVEERRTLTMQVEQLRSDLKKGSDEVARLKRAKEPADDAMASMKQLGDRIRDIEGTLRGVEDSLADLNLRIPNVPHESVPDRKSTRLNSSHT